MSIRNVTEHFTKSFIENLYFDLKSAVTEKPTVPTTPQYSSTTEEVRQTNYWLIFIKPAPLCGAWELLQVDVSQTKKS